MTALANDPRRVALIIRERDEHKQTITDLREHLRTANANCANAQATALRVIAEREALRAAIAEDLQHRAANLREQSQAYAVGSRQRTRFATRAEAFEDAARIVLSDLPRNRHNPEA